MANIDRETLILIGKKYPSLAKAINNTRKINMKPIKTIKGGRYIRVIMTDQQHTLYTIIDYDTQADNVYFKSLCIDDITIILASDKSLTERLNTKRSGEHGKG